MFVATARFEDGIVFAQSSDRSIAAVFGVEEGVAAPAFTMVKEGEEERVSVHRKQQERGVWGEGMECEDVTAAVCAAACRSLTLCVCGLCSHQHVW